VIQVNEDYGMGETPIPVRSEQAARSRQFYLTNVVHSRGAKVVRIESREVGPWKEAPDA
jgi:hypothetical protein